MKATAITTNDDDDNDETNSNELKVTMDTTINATVNNYIEEEIKVTYKNEDVTKDCKINYSLKTSSGTHSYTSSKELQDAINKLEAGTYKITYKINYEDLSITKAKTVKLS